MCSLLLLIVGHVIERARATVARLPWLLPRNVEAENVDLRGGGEKGGEVFCPREQASLCLLHDISIFVNANGLRNSAVHLGGSAVFSFISRHGFSQHRFVLLPEINSTGFTCGA